MTVSIHAETPVAQSIQFSNGHFSHLCERGVMLPAGILTIGGFDYAPDKPSIHCIYDVVATADEARAVGMAMRAYANAIKHAMKSCRPWLTRFDHDLFQMAEEIVAFCDTCQGFRLS